MIFRKLLMENKVFEKFSKIVYEKSGINLTEKKEALVSARIGKRMRELGLDDHNNYLKYIKDDTSGDEIVKLLDAVSTNVTSFFRESSHFEYVKTRFSEWLKNNNRKFRFWSAACSTGQEPYTLAMVLNETLDSRKADIKILATDISTRVLQKAINGIYDCDDTGSVPVCYRNKYLEKDKNNPKLYHVNNKLKSMVTFSRINLSQTPFVMKGPFDVVFCRNVMIYFDNHVRCRLLTEIYRLLKPEGILIVGHAESLTGMISGFTSVMPSVYIKSE